MARGLDSINLVRMKKQGVPRMNMIELWPEASNCIHGDGKHTVEFARDIRALLGASGVVIKRWTRSEDSKTCQG
ncbi:hypothetical protein GK047_19255 [Paenibacillus sp. SYP-B3998]|uniref:Uncharacterized protein n=1 Tax=Paenibacillus sp. SYP-B3998 TaxID=2678564 RepID=A0A6G4A2U2_9BACL|nr:hypothetical protein [Paenibacillus sp. SYP-B3998]NEW08141.1 hypothetical protein [Paenibacillus sp. SYP-B3998]